MQQEIHYKELLYLELHNLAILLVSVLFRNTTKSQSFTGSLTYKHSYTLSVLFSCHLILKHTLQLKYVTLY